MSQHQEESNNRRLPFTFSRVPYQESYPRFLHTSTYLNQSRHYAGIKAPADPRCSPAPYKAGWRAMRASGYGNWSKFSAHLFRWHSLSAPIPKKYLQHIGVKDSLLEAIVRFDFERFEEAKAKARPTRLVTRLMGGVFSVEDLPPEIITEEEAIDYGQARCLAQALRTCVLLDSIGSIFFSISKPPRKVWHPPTLGQTVSHYLFSEGNHWRNVAW